MAMKTKKKLVLTFRLIYFISCGYIFIYLSQGLYQNFTGSKVILTVSDLPVGNKGLLAPAIAVCSKNPLKNYSKAMLTLQEYMDNSKNVTSTILIDYTLLKFNPGSRPSIYVSTKFLTPNILGHAFMM